MRKPNDLYEVYQQMIAANQFGKSQKQIAVEIRPDLVNPRAKNPTKRAESWLHKCINPMQDRYFRPNDLLKFVEACGNADILINFLCEKLGFESPVQKLILSPEEELKLLRQILKDKKIKVDVKKYIESHKDIIGLSMV